MLPISFRAAEAGLPYKAFKFNDLPELSGDVIETRPQPLVAARNHNYTKMPIKVLDARPIGRPGYLRSPSGADCTVLLIARCSDLA